jgi:brefeldin A-resistance guanine nucleotide exchange factor 1
MTMPLFIVLSHHSINAAKEIRHSAISHLQRILLGSSLLQELEQSKVDEIFNRVVFPLVDELLKPQVASKDPHGMTESRLKSSALLCKVFMHLQLRESRANTDFRLLWIQVLDLLDRLMNVNREDQLVSQYSCYGCAVLKPKSVRSSPRISEKCSPCHECGWNLDSAWSPPH